MGPLGEMSSAEERGKYSLVANKIVIMPTNTLQCHKLMMTYNYIP